MTLPDVSGNPLLVWAAIVAGVLIVAAIAAEKGLTPLLRWWYELEVRKREAEHAREDADLRELRRIADNLSQSNDRLSDRISGLEQREDQQAQLLTAHTAWDFAVQRECARAGIVVPPPPPLRAHTS